MTVIKFKTSILIILFYTLVECDGRYLNGNIKPLNPVLTIGLNDSGVNISCSLSEFVNIDGVNVTSKHLYFSAGQLITSNARIVDDLTITLTLKDVSRFHSHVNVFCYANVSGVQHTVAQTRIVIVEPLVPPTFDGCVVNNWTEMVCEWHPSEPDFGIKTDVYFYYSIHTFSCQRLFSKCPKQVPGKCLFEPGTYFSALYCIFVCFNNTNGKACSEVQVIESKMLVKPGPVMGRWEAKSREADIRLDKPEPKVLYYLDIEGAGKRESFKSTKEVVHLVGLRPNTVYKVTVRCIPLLTSNGSTNETGFFSDPSILTFQTKPDVPDENPQVIPGSYNFDSSISPDGKSYVNIFWKKVPYEHENGKMNTTSITYYEYPLKDGDENGDEIRVENSHPVEVIVQSKWQLDRRKDYLVEVKSYNEMGSNHHIHPSRLIIPSTFRAPKPPEHIYATLVNNSIQLKWSRVEDADNYTVYWCHLHHSTRKCQTNVNIEWKSHIPPGTTEMIIPSSDNLDLRVGISVERFDSELNAVLSSGLTWTRCIHKYDADVLPPNNLHFSPHQHPHSLTIMWSHPECSASSYVSSYEVFWCKLNDDHCDRSLNITECCRGNSSFVTISKSLTSWIIERLVPSSEYEVRMRSVFFDRTSQFSNVEKRKVLETGFSKVIIGLIVTAAGLAIILCPIVIVMTICKGRKWCKDLQEKLNIITPSSEQINYSKYYYSTAAPVAETAIDVQSPANGDVGKVLISNGGHSGISTYTSVMQNPTPDDPLLQGTEQSDYGPLWESNLEPAPAPASEGRDDDDDVGADQNDQLGGDKKAKENVYV